MGKNEWVQHIETTENLVRPSAGGNLAAWKAAVSRHVEHKCSVCRKHATTNRRNRNARITRQVYRNCGLTRVVGPVSGKVYYE